MLRKSTHLAAQERNNFVSGSPFVSLRLFPYVDPPGVPIKVHVKYTISSRGCGAQRESQPLDFPFGSEQSAPRPLDLARQLSKIIHSASPGTGFMCASLCNVCARLWDQAGNIFNHAYIFIQLATSICICRALNTLRKDLIVRLRPETRKKYPLTLLHGVVFSIMHLIYLHFHGRNLISDILSEQLLCAKPDCSQSHKSYTLQIWRERNHKWDKMCVCVLAHSPNSAARNWLAPPESTAGKQKRRFSCLLHWFLRSFTHE